MIPLRDDIPTRTPPIVNYLIIAVCSVVFFAQLQDAPGEPSLVEKYGMIPARIVNSEADIKITVDQRPVMTPMGPMIQAIKREVIPPVIPPLATMLTCVFLHGGWLHFLGNMWFLHIFGDNVEDRFGHVGYALFYIGCGVAASLVHFVSSPFSAVPTIGASGAIAGVMGAYFIWYPHAKVQTLIPIFFFLHVAVLPAPLFLGIWFLIQAFQGSMSVVTMESSGVAWWAHIGGFLAGLIAAKYFGRSSWARPLNNQRRPAWQRARRDRF